MLSIRAVSKQFGGLRALDAVTLDVVAGETHGLMGANGAGKTTLFSIIAGHQAPTQGSIAFDGKLITGLSPDKICRLGIARTFQIVRPFPNLTVRENVETAVLFGRQTVPAALRAAADTQTVLEQTGLIEQGDKPASTLTLSGRKRLELARALGTAPRLLLLDEIMAGLTAAEVQQMIQMIGQIKQQHGLTILIIEHVVSALSDMSDTITVLHHGERIAQGSPSQITQDRAVQSAYFGSEAS